MSEELGELIDTINDEYRSAYEMTLDALTHAIACGAALIEARELIPEGEWHRWVGNNLDIGTSAAGRLMRIASHRDILMAAESKPRSINAAIRYLSQAGTPAASKGGTGRRPSFDVAEAKRLHGLGMTFKDIGQVLDVSDVAVRRQLVPDATHRAMERTSRARSRRRQQRRERQLDEELLTVNAAADAYVLLRECVTVLDRALVEATTGDERDGVTIALVYTHRAEHVLARIVTIDTQANKEEPTNA
jgi:hypothetical protein